MEIHRMKIAHSLGIGAAALCLAAGSARAQAAADKPVLDGKWHSSAAVGVTVTDGNSETLLGTVGLLAEKKTAENELRLGADAAYGEDQSETTTENAKAYSAYKYLINERAYGSLDASVAYDSIADLDLRVIVSPGIGYYLLKDDVQSLSVDGGPAYVHEELGGADAEDYLALRAGERYERKLSDTAKLWEAVEYLPRADDFDDYLLNAEAGVEAAINSTTSLRLTLKDTYDSTPAAGKDENDLTLVGAVVFKM
jgi:putative salt-induced outer membrane protein YdiY